MRTLITLAAAALLASGCASGGASATTSAPSGSRYVVTQAELARNADRSVYEVLLQTHPTFLRSRDPVTPDHPYADPVDVYVDQWGLGTVETIIPVYAPSGDNNDVYAYIQNVEQLVATWRAQSTATP